MKYESRRTAQILLVLLPKRLQLGGGCELVVDGINGPGVQRAGDGTSSLSPAPWGGRSRTEPDQAAERQCARQVRGPSQRNSGRHVPLRRIRRTSAASPLLLLQSSCAGGLAPRPRAARVRNGRLQCPSHANRSGHDPTTATCGQVGSGTPAL